VLVSAATAGTVACSACCYAGAWISGTLEPNWVSMSMDWAGFVAAEAATLFGGADYYF
jgi:hypothetical protein